MDDVLWGAALGFALCACIVAIALESDEEIICREIFSNDPVIIQQCVKYLDDEPFNTVYSRLQPVYEARQNHLKEM